MRSLPTRPWKIGVCGCGSSLQLYKGLESFTNILEVAAVADPNPASRESAQKIWSVTEAYDDCTTMFDAEDLDLVLIATPPSTHHTLAMEAANRDIHLLIQKPLARTIKEASEIISACKRQNVALGVSFSRRYTPVFLAVEDLIKGLGQAHALRITWSSSSGIGERTDKLWKTEQATLGGILVDYGTHVVDLARWWMGDILNGHLDMSITNGEVENVASFLLNHSSGGHTICTLSNVECDSKEVYEYTGSNGGFILEKLSDGYPGDWSLTHWTVENRVKHTENFVAPEENPFITELKDLVKKIETGQMPIDNENLGFGALYTTTMLYRSVDGKTDQSIDKFSLEDFFREQGNQAHGR